MLLLTGQNTIVIPLSLLFLPVREKFCSPHTVYHTLFEEGREKGARNIMEGVNWFIAHCLCVWNYHNEIPSLLMYDNSKI
jgi:hypothetical protein